MLGDKAILLPYIRSIVRGDMLRKTVFQLRSRMISKELMFDEANPVTLRALKTLCNLCGLLLIVAVVLFLREVFAPAHRTLKSWLVCARSVWFRVSTDMETKHKTIELKIKFVVPNWLNMQVDSS